MMRRKDRQITDPARIREIFTESMACRVAFCGETGPYIVPLSFGGHYNEAKRAGRGRRAQDDAFIQRPCCGL